MRRIVILLIFITLSKILLSQNSSPSKPYLIIPLNLNDGIGHSQFIIANNVNVRSAPNINSKIMTQLNSGDSVLLLERIDKEILEINGIKAPWYKINYQSENSIVDGYVCGYFISSGYDTTDIDFDGFSEIVFWRCYTDSLLNTNEIYPYISCHISDYSYIKNGVTKPLIIQKEVNEISSIESIYEFSRFINTGNKVNPKIVILEHAYGSKSSNNINRKYQIDFFIKSEFTTHFVFLKRIVTECDFYYTNSYQYLFPDTQNNQFIIQVNNYSTPKEINRSFLFKFQLDRFVEINY